MKREGGSVTRRKPDDELAQVEAALRRIRRKEAEARACTWSDAPGRDLYLLKRYEERKFAVDSIANELIDRYGVRQYTRTEISTVIEGRQRLPAPNLELTKRAARLGAVQRDILRDIARNQRLRVAL
jgi:hypothetical protein